MYQQHCELFLQKLEVEKELAALQDTCVALQQQITTQHLEQEYEQFKNCAWLPKEQQELVNSAVALRTKIFAERNQERRKELVAQFDQLEAQLEQENLLDDYLCAWRLAELLKK